MSVHAHRGRTEELIELIYDAAVDPVCWPPFLTRFAEVMHGTLTSVHVQDLLRDRGSIGAAVRFDPEWIRAYEERYAALNVFMNHRVAPILQPGRVVTGEMVCNRRELIRSEYYNDFLRPQDLWHLCGAILVRNGNQIASITTMRPRRWGPFSDRQLAVLTRLVPHLQKALHVHRRLAAAEADTGAARNILDRLHGGVLVVSRNAEVVFANDVAERILTLGDGISVHAGRVVCRRWKDTRSLHAAIEEACDAPSPEAIASTGFLTIDRGSRPSLIAFSAPLTRRAALFGDAATLALVFLADPEVEPVVPEQSLRALYGLTRAESAVAAHLLRGKRLPDTAEALGISLNTAKTHAQRIYAKTDTTGQATFIALCWRTLGATVNHPQTCDGRVGG